jgi:hypothetical protein
VRRSKRQVGALKNEVVRRSITTLKSLVTKKINPLERNGAPDRIRTCDLRLVRRPRRKGLNRSTPAKSVYTVCIKGLRVS